MSIYGKLMTQNFWSEIWGEVGIVLRVPSLILSPRTYNFHSEVFHAKHMLEVYFTDLYLHAYLPISVTNYNLHLKIPRFQNHFFFCKVSFMKFTPFSIQSNVVKSSKVFLQVLKSILIHHIITTMQYKKQIADLWLECSTNTSNS